MKRSTLLVLLSVLLLLSCNKQAPKTGIDFTFTADERLFTAHAFMNAAGFDLEYREEGMHPIRIEIRNKLNERLSSSYIDSIRTYYFSHIRSLGDYGTYAFALTPAPEFNLVFDSASSSPWAAKDINALTDLNEQLKEFYYKADIPGLWSEYQPALQEHHDKFKPYANLAFNDLKQYLGIKELPSDMTKGQIITAYSPLMSYFNAFTVIVNNDVYIVNGPQPNEPSPSSYYHEAAHHFVDRVVRKNAESLQRIQPLIQFAEENVKGTAYSVVEESLVRALQILLDAQLFSPSAEQISKTVNNEYRLGFILCPYFVETLPEFSASGRAFEEYFPDLIAGIDIEYETNRWNTFWGQVNN